MHKKVLFLLMIASVVTAGFSITGCDLFFGSSSSSPSAPAGLTIQGRLGGVEASSVGTGVGSLGTDSDWVIVAIYWGPDFEHPDIMSQLESDGITGDTLDMDSWEEAAVIPVGPDGSFSWNPPADRRFVLFAVDHSNDADPVRGLLGIGAGGDLVWQALESDLLSGTVDLGQFSPTDERLVWGSETTVQDLADSGQLDDLDTVLQVAFFNDGVGWLKNHLSTGFDISDAGITERESRLFLVANSELELDATVEQLKNGIEPTDFVPSSGFEYEYGIFIVGRWPGSAPASVKLEKPDGTEVPTWFGVDAGVLSARAVETAGDFSPGMRFSEHYPGSWIIDIDGTQYGVNLDSVLSTERLTSGNIPFPLPRIQANGSGDTLESLGISWFRVENSQAVALPDATLQRILHSYGVAIEFSDERDDFKQIITPATGTTVTVEPAVEYNDLDQIGVGFTPIGTGLGLGPDVHLPQD